MALANGRIRPNTYIFLRLPTDQMKLIEIKPNTIIDAGKYGSFPANLLIGRPLYYTYEIVEKRKDEAYSRLRAVPPSELNADVVAEEAEATPAESRAEPATPAEGIDIVADDGTVLVKNNRLTVDEAGRQILTQAEIEELKKSAGGKEIIEKILANHTGLDEKTSFSKAKYTLRKTKKYLKRFTVLPMELGYLIDYVLEKEPGRIMEIREESLGLVNAWSNAHFSEAIGLDSAGADDSIPGGNWLVVDDTGGLVVASIAERMGLLRREDDPAQSLDPPPKDTAPAKPSDADQPMEDASQDDKPIIHRDYPTPASSNTITIVHPAVQPNASLLKYFGYDTNVPDASHPLHTHLSTLSWLQLLHPTEDPTYREPPPVDDATLQTWKSGKRGTYFKKRRRWARCQAIVDRTHAGGFDGLVIASHMQPATMLPHLLPLVRGGGHVAIYSPTIESLTSLTDLYSKDRRTAYLAARSRDPDAQPDTDDFPVDPRALLAPTLQTSRAREWQVLPGRTHPLMTSKGGSEGFVFTARKVIPLEGGVEARGKYGKKRKAEGEAGPESGREKGGAAEGGGVCV